SSSRTSLPRSWKFFDGTSVGKGTAMKTWLHIFFFSLMGFLAGCALHETQIEGVNLMSHPQIAQSIEDSTRHDVAYQGLYNTIELWGTLRNNEVILAQLHQSAHFAEWDKVKYLAESNKAEEKAKKETEVFLSFYTPEHKNDDLNKDKSQWRVYLEAA